jgi:hypothetical protein
VEGEEREERRTVYIYKKEEEEIQKKQKIYRGKKLFSKTNDSK